MDLDRHIPRDSPIHGFDARLKLILALAAIVAITLLPAGAFAAYAIVLAALTAGSLLARLGPARLVRGSWIVLPFALVALPLLFTRPGAPLFAADLGPFGLTATREGLRDVISIVVKSWLSVQVALLLAYTTPFPALLDALRSLRLPAILVSIVGFMYRYLAVIGDEAGRMMRARASRSASTGEGGGSIAWRARVTGSLVGSLFVRSYERSERIYAAMLARGFDGTLRGTTLARPTRDDLVAFGFVLAIIALFTALTVGWGPLL
jgi:cobalt/nickel transport system permease protein